MNRVWREGAADRNRIASPTSTSCILTPLPPATESIGAKWSQKHLSDYGTDQELAPKARRNRSIHEVLRAKYKYLNRRLSLVRVCTQDRNRWSPSKLGEPSATTSSSFLFSRASCHFFEIRAAFSVVSVVATWENPACTNSRSFSPSGL